MNYERLFSPIKIRGLKLKNRVIFTPVHHLYTPEGYATERFNAFYWRRAEGGAGLLMTGGCRFDDCGGADSMMSLKDDSFIPGYKEFTDGCHKRGAKVGVQLFHAGAYTKKQNCLNGAEPMSASAVPSKYSKETPREMTREDIRQVMEDWAAAAVRAQKAGFDMVELLGSAGYLICQFLSPLTNQREDEYGGSAENRRRFPLELIRKVRAAVGPDYPLSLRISGNDFVHGSNGLAEAVEFAKEAEAAGIDLISVTGGWHETQVPQLPGDLPRGGLSYLAAAVKDAVSIPVVSGNRYSDPAAAELALALGKADMVGVMRGMIADPDWCRKAEEGRAAELRHCVACNQGCLAKTFFGKPVECLVNPQAGREFVDFKSQKAAKGGEKQEKKKLLVVGGGAAGCSFAIAAAERGHKVTLWEKTDRLGGQIALAAAPPGKQEFLTLIPYFEAMLAKTGVEVCYNTEATAKTVRAFEADLVILAAGSKPKKPPMPVKEKGIKILTAAQVLAGEEVAGRDVLVLGGGSVGCETAQFLAQEGSLSSEALFYLTVHQAESQETIQQLLNSSRRRVAVAEIQPKLGNGFEPGTGWPVMKDLKRLGVKTMPLTTLVELRADVAVLKQQDKEGKETTLELPCDTLVLALGSQPEQVLYDKLQRAGVPVRIIGDSMRVGKLLDAIQAGFACAQFI